jgi:dipeptidyl aminopeptidase/acylaminoacyl peptidase
VDFPEIPDGTVTGVSISQSEQKMRLSVGSSKSPNDFYLYDLKTNTIKKLTNSLNPELNADHLVAAEVIRFASFDGLEIPAIYYKPIQASAKEKVPGLGTRWPWRTIAGGLFFLDPIFSQSRLRHSGCKQPRQ